MTNPYILVIGIGLSVSLFAIMAIYPIGYIQGFFLLRPVFESLSEYKIASGFPVTGLISGLNIVCLFVWLISGKIKKILVPNFLPLYILIFVGSLSFINSPSLSISLAHLIRLISWISLGVIVYNAISHRKDVVKVLAAISYSSIVPMIFGYYQYFLKRGTIDPVTGPYRASSVFTVDSWGIFLCFSIFATLFLYIESKKMGMRKISMSCIPIFVSLLVSLGLTYHRGSWIALTLSIILILLMTRKLKLLLLFSVIASIIAIGFHDEIIDRFSDLFVKRQYGFNSLEARFILWKSTIALLPNHFLIGHGLGCGKEILTMSGSLSMVPHNDYLRLLLEVGVLGFLLYFLMLVGEIFTSFKMFKYKNLRLETSVLFGCLTYFILISATQNIMYDVINMGLMVSLLSVMKKRTMLEHSPT